MKKLFLTLAAFAALTGIGEMIQYTPTTEERAIAWEICKTRDFCSLQTIDTIAGLLRDQRNDGAEIKALKIEVLSH